MTSVPSLGPDRADAGLAAAATQAVAKWLGLAATPTFAAMALLAATPGKPTEMLCAAGALPSLSGMVPMYLLMSAFHTPAWLRLFVRR